MDLDGTYGEVVETLNAIAETAEVVMSNKGSNPVDSGFRAFD